MAQASPALNLDILKTCCIPLIITDIDASAGLNSKIASCTMNCEAATADDIEVLNHPFVIDVAGTTAEFSAGNDAAGGNKQVPSAFQIRERLIADIGACPAAECVNPGKSLILVAQVFKPVRRPAQSIRSQSRFIECALHQNRPGMNINA